MVHHIVLFRLKPELPEDRVEEMMRKTRMMLLKIPEVYNVRCGKRIDPGNPYPFFLSADFESMDRLIVYMENPIHLKFMEEVVKPNASEWLIYDFEMEPGKDIRYS